MKGMHVHHRLPQSQGGTHDPSNLYVCSPSFHAYAWHGEDSFLPLVENCTKAGKIGGKTQRRRNVESGHLAIICLKGGHVAGKINGRKNVESGHWEAIRTPESRAKGGKVTNSQKWKCLVTNYISTPGPLSRYQKARGIDTSLREQVHQEPA
jgi:hypothetical protein